METLKLRQRIAEIAVVCGGLNLLILIGTLFYGAVQWSVITFKDHPYIVVTSWSGGLSIISTAVVGIMFWLSREKEETKEDVE